MSRTYRSTQRVTNLKKEVYADERARNCYRRRLWNASEYDADLVWYRRYYDKTKRGNYSESGRLESLKKYSNKTCRAYYRQHLIRSVKDEEYDFVYHNRKCVFQDRWTWF